MNASELATIARARAAEANRATHAIGNLGDVLSAFADRLEEASRHHGALVEEVAGDRLAEIARLLGSLTELGRLADFVESMATAIDAASTALQPRDS
jgi:hypothetical protein